METEIKLNYIIEQCKKETLWVCIVFQVPIFIWTCLVHTVYVALRRTMLFFVSIGLLNILK